MNQISKIKFPPIKYKSLGKKSEELIYKTGLRYYYEPTSEIFIMLRSKEANKRSYMAVIPQTIQRDGKNDVASLFISKIISSPMREGFGAKFLDFAQIYSKKIGCNGNLHLIAVPGFTPQQVPHIFYKKYGMNTNSASINKRLDKLIKKNKNGTYLDFNNIEMYYPPIKKPETKFDIFFNFLKDLFK